MKIKVRKQGKSAPGGEKIHVFQPYKYIFGYCHTRKIKIKLDLMKCILISENTKNLTRIG